MKNEEYWEERQTKKFKRTEKSINDYYKELEKQFNRAKRDIQELINAFYSRYATEKGITYTDAMIKLKNEELEGINAYIENVNKLLQGEDVAEKVIVQSIKARVTRLEGIMSEIDARLTLLYAQYENDSTGKFREVYKESYLNTCYNIDIAKGYHNLSTFIGINDNAIEEIIKYPFDGAYFSDRIWRQKEHLVQAIKDELVTMVVQGRNPNTLSSSFSKRFKTKKYEAYRLLHTEHSFVVEKATQNAYKEDEVEKYMISATLDSRTCPICGREDRKVYKVINAVTGKNAPPFHPLCRCTTIPYYDDEDMEDMTRVARDSKGKNVTVPANMTYTEWKNKFAS